MPAHVRWAFVICVAVAGCGTVPTRTLADVADTGGEPTVSDGADDAANGELVSDVPTCISLESCRVSKFVAGKGCQEFYAADGTLCGSADAACEPPSCHAGVCQPSFSVCLPLQTHECDQPTGTCSATGSCEPNFKPEGAPCGVEGCLEGACSGNGKCVLGFKAKGTACTAEKFGLCDLGNGSCDGSGDCVLQHLPVGTSCAMSPCVVGTCSADAKCADPKVMVGEPCPAKSTGPCFTSAGKCGSAGECVVQPAVVGTSCPGPHGQCDQAPYVCDGTGQCTGAVKPAGTPCETKFTFKNSDWVGATTWDGSELNPCLDLPSACNAKGQCAPKSLVGKPCNVVPGSCWLGKSGVCDASGHCAGTPAVGAPCSPTESGAYVDYPGKPADPCRPKGTCTATGSCDAPLVTGAPCTTADPCRPVGACDPGGKCIAPVAVGKVCDKSPGLCQARTCQADGSCATGVTPGVACKKDANPCLAGTCQPNGTCVQVIVPGTQCPTGDPCAKGTCASDGHCAHTVLLGATCLDGKGKCRGDGLCARACKLEVDCKPYPGCGLGNGQCGADGLCFAVPVPSDPYSTSLPACVTAITCNEFGSLTWTGLPDGVPCPSFGDCAKGSVCMGGHCIIADAAKTSCETGVPCNDSMCVVNTGLGLWSPSQFGMCLYHLSYSGNCESEGCSGSYCKSSSLGTGWEVDKPGYCGKPYTGEISSCQQSCGSKCQSTRPCRLNQNYEGQDGCPCRDVTSLNGSSCGGDLQCWYGECVLP